MTCRVCICSLTIISMFVGVPFAGSTAPPSRVNVHIVADEADAVLAILAKRAAHVQVSEADWEGLFSTEGYVRLKKRETSLHLSFEDSTFKQFVLSDELLSRSALLETTLVAWKKADMERVAQRPLAYLPASATIHATIYPVIKPGRNSFVFELRDNPAIFLYVDPEVSRDKFENTVAHELHHVGYGTACPDSQAAREITGLAKPVQDVLDWVGAFGEGFAMLAAAGGPDVHPHAASDERDRKRWDRDVANFDGDLHRVEGFFLDVLDGRLSEIQRDSVAYSFFGIQGPWYTVGWQMVVVIEKTFGRAELIDCMCDPRSTLETFNRAVVIYNKTSPHPLALWSPLLLQRLRP